MKYQPKTSVRKIRFSLVEIILALTIMVIGLIGIISLFPIAMETEKKAIIQYQASDAMETFLHFSSSKIKQDWSWSNSFPMNAKYPGDDSQIVWSETDLIPESENIDIRFKINDGDIPSVQFNPNTHQSGVYKLEQKSKGTVEFSSILRCWQTYGSVVIHVENSSPPELPYQERDKVEFSLRCVKATAVALRPAAAKHSDPITNSNSSANETQIEFTDYNLDWCSGSDHYIMNYIVDKGTNDETSLAIGTDFTLEYDSSDTWKLTELSENLRIEPDASDESKKYGKLVIVYADGTEGDKCTIRINASGDGGCP